MNIVKICRRPDILTNGKLEVGFFCVELYYDWDEGKLRGILLEEWKG